MAEDIALKVLAAQSKNRKKGLDTDIPVTLGSYGDTRFTKTPVLFSNTSDSPSEVTGGTTMGLDPMIKVDTPKTGASYKDLNNTIHHEDIHAMMEKFGLGDIPFQTLWKSDPEFTKTLLRLWGKSRRAGDVSSELPAYMGAFNPKLINAPTDTKNEYLQNLEGRLPPAMQELFQRIMSSHEASQMR